MTVDVQNELLKPPDNAPLTAELIRRSLPVLVGGPLHGEDVPVSLMNRSHIEFPVGTPGYLDEGVDSTYETALYERGKYASQGSRRVLDVWYHTGLSEDERGALTWLVILERAGLT